MATSPIYKRLGTRTIMGTNWNVENKVERVAPSKWRVTFQICNGTASGSKDFRTKREALEAAGIDA